MEYYIRMSLRQWLAMFAFFGMYVFLGSCVFYTLEHNLETDRRAVQLQERIEINDLLATYTSPDDFELQHKILSKVSDYCGRKVTNHTLDEHVDPYVWSYFHAFYFSFTTCTTVGYGNISPSTSLGRIILCFYALFGIPISCFFIATVAHFFAATYIRLYKQYTDYKHANTKNYVPPAVGLVGKICLYLTPGIIIFIFVPAIFFSYFEDWDYIRAVYFAFITLSTVGYGDLVATFQAHQEREFHVYFAIYEAFIIFWNIAGLGYVLMIINFVAKAMKSKKVAKIEHKISQNIRATEHLVRQEVSRDLNFLRRLLNEVNFMKVKPVYTDEMSKRVSLPRSSSCPDLLQYHYHATSNGRSHSIAASSLMREGSTTLKRKSLSDSNLHLIDRQKTFQHSTNSFGSQDLITKVVSALGSIQQVNQDERSIYEFGVNGFSDSQILSSERVGSAWSLNRFDADFDTSRSNSISGSNRWNGRASHIIDDAKDANTRPGAFNRSVSLDIPDDDGNLQNIVNREVLHRVLNRTNSPKSVAFQETVDVDRKTAKRGSIISLPREYLAATSRGRSSILSILDAPVNTSKSELLEKTSIADLIRALEVVHSASAKEDVQTNVPPKMKTHLSQIVNGRRGSLNQNVGSRRGSLRPIPGYTTIFSSADGMDPLRKISSQSTPESYLSRQLSLRPHYPPPQYSTAVPRSTLNQFNASRSSNRYPERANPSTLLQRKLPHGPSPLARNT